MSSTKSLNDISAKSNIMLNFGFIILSIICIAPFFLILGVSFTAEASIMEFGYNFIPKTFDLSSYEFLLKDADYILKSYGITIFVTVVGTILSVSVIALFAYPLSRKDFKYRKQFSFFVFFTMIFNGGLIPWYIVYSVVLGLKDNIFVYIVPYLMNAWYVILMRTFFNSSVPESVLESAKLDGAGELRIFFSIVLKLSLPGLATVALFSSINYWNDWWLALIFITDQKLFNLQYSMYTALTSAQYMAENASKMGANASAVFGKTPVETARMAMCIIAIGPILFIYPYFQKYFIKGLTVGAVKG